MTHVLDASVVVAALVDTGAAGRWAESILAEGPLVAPHLMPIEVTHVLRRAVISHELTKDVASLAMADLVAMPVEYFPYEPFAERVWELSSNVTAYDAWYVALAESLGAELATLDRRLTRAAGPRCAFVTA